MLKNPKPSNCNNIWAGQTKKLSNKVKGKSTIGGEGSSVKYGEENTDLNDMDSSEDPLLKKLNENGTLKVLVENLVVSKTLVGVTEHLLNNGKLPDLVRLSTGVLPDLVKKLIASDTLAPGLNSLLKADLIPKVFKTLQQSGVLMRLLKKFLDNGMISEIIDHLKSKNLLSVLMGSLKKHPDLRNFVYSVQ
jgi:hypothetical protein